MRIRYMNIGDPVAAGFQTPPHLIEAVHRAIRDGHNGYLPSAGLPEAREAVAADYTARGVSVSADRVLITDGTSEGIDIALNALVDEGDDVLVPTPPTRCTQRCLRKSARRHGTTAPIRSADGFLISTTCAAS